MELRTALKNKGLANISRFEILKMVMQGTVC